MRRVILLLICAIILACFTGCNKDEESATTETTNYEVQVLPPLEKTADAVSQEIKAARFNAGGFLSDLNMLYQYNCKNGIDTISIDEDYTKLIESAEYNKLLHEGFVEDDNCSLTIAEPRGMVITYSKSNKNEAISYTYQVETENYIFYCDSYKDADIEFYNKMELVEKNESIPNMDKFEITEGTVNIAFDILTQDIGNQT